MKKRMQTIFTITWADGTQWRGNCKRWATESPLRTGETLTSERTLWVGTPWRCTACELNLHRRGVYSVNRFTARR